MEKKMIFVICPVRLTTKEQNDLLEAHVLNLETDGHTVHLPKRDTEQNALSAEICHQNLDAIVKADEVHVFFSEGSAGTHFDMGAAFALGKRIVLVHEFDKPDAGVNKSFNHLLYEVDAAGMKKVRVDGLKQEVLEMLFQNFDVDDVITVVDDDGPVCQLRGLDGISSNSMYVTLAAVFTEDDLVGLEKKNARLHVVNKAVSIPMWGDNINIVEADG